MAEKSWQAGPLRVRVTTRDEPPKERLTRDRIVDVALEQMAESGYDAVSMRSVARALGTGPASLYAHVSNKDELDQLVLDRIASQMAVPEPDPARWQEQVRQMLRDMLAGYRAHPGSARAALATIPTMEGGLRVADGIMAVLLAGGVDRQAAAWFLDLSALYVSAIGAEESIWEDRRKAASTAGTPVAIEDVVAEIHRIFSTLPAATYPALAPHVAEMTTGDGEERFEFGLDVLLAGLEVVSARMR
jgi:AcrR family transcriptional regulator